LIKRKYNKKNNRAQVEISLSLICHFTDKYQIKEQRRKSGLDKYEEIKSKIMIPKSQRNE
jgi:hypothetical protein